VRARALDKLFAARRRRSARREADEPLLDDVEKRRDLMKRLAAGIAANKLPPR
jgi:hypothetical protein